MKKRLLSILLLLLSFTLFSQEDSFFSDDDSSNFSEVDNSSIFTVDSSSSVDFSGLVMGEDNFFDLVTTYNWTIESSYIDIISNVKFDFNNYDSLDSFPLQGNEFPGDIAFDELYLRYYNFLFDLEVGLLKPIWGSADGMHVVDVLNPIDYRSPFGGTYLEGKIAQQMVKINIPIGDNSLLEAVYEPSFSGNSIPDSGIWEPYYLATLRDKIYEMVYEMGYSGALAQALSLTPGATEEMVKTSVLTELEDQTDTLYNTLSIEEKEYGIGSQYSGRFTTSLSSIDLGVTYYNGFLRLPTLDPDDVLKTGKLTLIFNRVQTLGLDIAAQAGSFNMKGELAYNLTSDINGDMQGINNNSLGYVVGFDINLPINSVNFMLQGVGDIILSSNSIKTGDPQFSKDNEYSSLAIMGRVSDNYLNEKLYVEVSGIYDAVKMDYFIEPKVTFKPSDSIDIYCEYLLLDGDETGNFGQYRDNDTLKIGIKILL